LSTLSIATPRAYLPLLAPNKRFLACWGGRGSGKSHFFAELLIERCVMEPTRAVCIREVQASIKESVKQLLADKIQALGLGHFFQVLETEIRGANGSLIMFKGMQSYNAENIKSLEGCGIAWVEEAQSLSVHSWKMLRPTIRKPGSQIWCSWNPRHDNDAVDAFFRRSPPPEAAVVEVHWHQNPWFPDVLAREKDHDYTSDPESAEHVWGGGYQIVTEGAYYAKLLATAQSDGRIGAFPYDPKLKLKTAWDIGVDDYTAIWFVQDDGRKAYVVDYYETSGEGAEQIVPACMPELMPDQAEGRARLLELGRSTPFKYEAHFLPHDVQVREWGSGGRTRFQTLQALGVRPIRTGAQQGPSERINAVRRLLPVLHFNDTSRVQTGLSRLRRYSRKWNDAMQSYTTPLHDQNSHGADALGEYAVNCGIRPALADKTRSPDESYRRSTRTAGASSWRI
jgi:phage terminase large subunit